MKCSDIIQAARDACIHDDIIALKGGYDSQVAEGGSLTAWNTKVIDASKLAGTVVTPSTPTINESFPNNDFHAAGSPSEEATFTPPPFTPEQRKEFL